jgi:hypothetical protein
MAHDRMQRQRFEFKYLLDERKALQVRQYVDGYLELDEASRDKPSRSYRVNSLYLDSDSLITFWDWVNSNRNRFKLRIRYYDELPQSPLFLEIKRRVSGCILKQRCAVSREAIHIILAGQIPPLSMVVSKGNWQLDALNNFVSMVGRLEAKPKALVTYMREAYVHRANEGIRVTMDRQVSIGPRESADFKVHMDRFEQPFGEKVILELKFTNRFPDWFAEMVRVLGLTRAAAAKYCEGMAALNHHQLGNMHITGRHRRRTRGLDAIGQDLD